MSANRNQSHIADKENEQRLILWLIIEAFLPSYSSILRRKNEAFSVTGCLLGPGVSSRIIASTLASLLWLELLENLFDKCRRRKLELGCRTSGSAVLTVRDGEVEHDCLPFSVDSGSEVFEDFIITLGGSDILQQLFFISTFISYFRRQLYEIFHINFNYLLIFFLIKIVSSTFLIDIFHFSTF